MAGAVELVVGLGNPGPRYADTRHNVGFWFAERVAAEHRVSFRAAPRFHGQLARVEDPPKFWLLEPATFMNRSGQSVAAVARFYRLPVENILVVHDDLDLPPGTVRLKRGGGPGGHNGLKDVIGHLGDREFLRLRIGIGHPGSADMVLNYVLGEPRREERDAIEDALGRALEVLPRILGGEVERAMNVLNARR